MQIVGSARRRPRRLLGLSVLLPAVLLLSACHTTPPTVVVYGDSVATQARTYIDYFTSLNGVAQVVNHIFPGTMPCTLMNQMLADADNPIQASAAVIEFSGVSGIGCMSGIPIGSPQFYARYRSDTNTAVDAFIANGIHVFLVGYPIAYSDVNPQNLAQVTKPHWDRLDLIYQSIAAAHAAQVTFIDAGASVEGPNGQFVWDLPCLPYEQVCNVGTPGWTIPQGYNQVRAPDGYHFCPVPPPGFGFTCPVYASGAMRYGLAIATSVRSWLAGQQVQ